jgi:hypothetical protein
MIATSQNIFKCGLYINNQKQTKNIYDGGGPGGNGGCCECVVCV